MTAKQRATRAGFTLVEILMVIAIIAVLAALLTTAIARTRNTARKVQAQNDVQSLEATATKFKQDFGFYPPSHVTTTAGVMRFMVPTKISGAGTEQNQKSLEVLQRMFPRWQPVGNASNDITPALPLAGTALDPNQSLVYFLGGPNGGGFDVASPNAPTGSTKKGPYFDFPPGRLAVPEPVTNYTSGNGLPNFVDPWGMPYAYFAAGGDAYDVRVTFPLPAGGSNDYTTEGSGSTRPLRQAGKWLNPGKVQIVCAGPNRLFGMGSPQVSGPPVNSTTPTAVYQELKPGLSKTYSENDAGEDDIANFNEGSALGTSSTP